MKLKALFRSMLVAAIICLAGEARSQTTLQQAFTRIDSFLQSHVAAKIYPALPLLLPRESGSFTRKVSAKKARSIPAKH